MSLAARWFVGILVFLFAFTGTVVGQSTATIQGTVTDATGAIVPNATVTVRNQDTGEVRTTATDSAGLYVVPSLPIGTYRVEVAAQGMQTMVAANLHLEVGANVRQDFTMNVAATTQTVEITASGNVVDTNSVSAGGSVNQNTVQEIPLNGRHFVDLALLIPGSVTPPANGFLTAPLRGQGSFAFNTAGAREDQINYMINGINLSDPVQNQITFQPTINTVAEAKIDNSTFPAEYGRNSGAIVNIATRSGANQWHGEGYEFMRNSFLDARNFTNPIGIHQAPFIRNQFGGDGGGAIKKDKTFFYLSYEGLRQRQAVSTQSLVLTSAQRAQAQASGDPIVQKLLPLIPAPNSGTNLFASTAVANVNIDQGTANVSHNFNDANRINFYYAYQKDLRGEPPGTDANTLPGFGDIRQGHRQLMTINETDVISPSMVNEARLGYNRIHITFNADNTLNAADYGINSGVTSAIGLPQISIAGGGGGGGLEFGGVNGFPQGRGDYTASTSDTLSWTHGTHVIMFGGEYRRIDNNNFSYTPGTFTFASINTFIADQANGFTANPSNGSSRVFVNSIGAFVQDNWKIKPRIMLQRGVRYDWYGTPTEAENRFVVFDPTSDSLINKKQPYQQSALNFQPRTGLAWDVFGNGKTVVRTAYAIMADQPITGIVTALATNPPYAFPVNFAPTAATPFVTFANAFTAAGGSVAPRSIIPNYKDSYAQEYNFNIQQQLANDFGFMVGYFGTKGTDLNIIQNMNQPINGAKPFPALSANSPIFPGKPLSTILVQESDANSDYNGLWLTVMKRFQHGLQFNADYSWSKSIDYNSRTNNATSTFLPQNSYDIRNDRGLSDFDVRHRLVLNGIYDLPFKGNRLKEGWELATIVQLQTGNPINFHTTNGTFTGITQELRPSVTGPVKTGFTPATNGAATAITYIQNPGVFFDQGAAFGDLGRNAVEGPGFSNVDFALVKDTKLTERLTWQVRADAFDLLNTVNFTQPVSTVGTSTLGLITGGTRFPTGDFGSARQLQLAMKLIF
jgi:hypothetical protein